MGNWPADFTDLKSKLGKKVPSGRIGVLPGVELNSDFTALLWPVRSLGRGKYVTPTGAMFNRFVELCDAPPVEIHRFAQKWGALNVDSRGRFRGWWLSVEGDSIPEPIDAWRYFSRRARSVLGLAAKLRDGNRGGAANWAALSSLATWLSPNLKRDLERYQSAIQILADRDLAILNDSPVDEQRNFLSVELTLWMKFTGLGFAYGDKLEIDYNGCLLAAVALQLSLIASGVEALYICSGSGCGQPYVRSKKSPNPGARNFCDTCGRAEAVRQADERRRQKIQEARRLDSQGVPIQEITRRLGVRSTAIVRRWIKKGK